MTQLSKALFSSEKEDWETPQDFLTDWTKYNGSINEALMAFRKIKEIHEERKSEEKRNTNNWRKMHGLTMRRRCKRRKKAWMKKKR